ncbi:MAG TPA: ABC transporter substrate-binding protein, partial [Accumulibacter sp.]|nr:ABC transporter substrate-binding protein [Accumulibacter sp.]
MAFKQLSSRLLAAIVLFGTLFTAQAETTEVRLAQQYGISYLPLMQIEQNRLLEKHAAARGLGEIKVTWSKFAGGNVMNDAL